METVGKSIGNFLPRCSTHAESIMPVSSRIYEYTEDVW